MYMRLWARMLGTAVVMACAAAGSVHAAGKPAAKGQRAAVKHVADQRLAVATPQGKGMLAIYADHQLAAPAPEVKRVLLVVHGTLRNADSYFADGRQARQAAGAAGADTLVAAPQFLTHTDVQAFGLAADTLEWTAGGWKDGAPAVAPAPISSFAALDALLAHFADRKLYPALAEVVLAGHSAGAQVVQRYAVAGQGEAALRRAGIRVRYVVANPSSYLYFDDERPSADGSFRPADAAACAKAVKWKYGLEDVPPYVQQEGTAGLEARYAGRDVVYMLGMADTNPYTHFIDRSCAGMAQGPYRLARGLAYFSYMQRRHPSGLQQSLVEVPGVGHDGRGMFTSACGLAILFGTPIPDTCPHKP
jgi:pimeloyl-ACP methyl ester carboxylesterase